MSLRSQIKAYTCTEFKQQNPEFIRSLTNYEYMYFSDLVDSLIEHRFPRFDNCPFKGNITFEEKVEAYIKLFKDFEEYPPLSLLY